MEASALDRAGGPPGRAGGFTDWLPGAAELRQRLAETCLDTFAAWGYGLVATPLVEPADTVGQGVGAQESLFRFVDSDGVLLAIVGERTVSVARVVATQLRDAQRPLRLCYSGAVLRNRPLLGGRRRESVQAGAELVGEPSLAADAECVALAAEALSRAGLEGVQIDVGHADFLRSLLDGTDLDAAAHAAVLGALGRRDLVAVEAALAGTPVGAAERDLLLRFPALRGGRELLDAAAAGLQGSRPHRVLEELGALWDLLLAHGLGDRIHLDLGAVRDLDYYTGPIFEILSGDLGFPLGGGGRYDGLLARFGAPEPATGFVLMVDRCCDALARRGGAAAAASAVAAPDALRVAWAEGRQADAIRLAARLRAERPGVAVVCDLAGAAAAPVGAAAYVGSAGLVAWRSAAVADERPGAVAGPAPSTTGTR